MRASVETEPSTVMMSLPAPPQMTMSPKEPAMVWDLPLAVMVVFPPDWETKMLSLAEVPRISSSVKLVIQRWLTVMSGIGGIWGVTTMDQSAAGAGEVPFWRVRTMEKRLN